MAQIVYADIAECNSALVMTPDMIYNLVLDEFIECEMQYLEYQMLLDLSKEITSLPLIHTTILSINDPIVWKPGIYNYAIACDIFPRMTEIWDLPYLVRCYETCEVPKAEKAMFIPELY